MEELTRQLAAAREAIVAVAQAGFDSTRRDIAIAAMDSIDAALEVQP